MEERIKEEQIEEETSDTIVFANYQSGDFYIILHPKEADDDVNTTNYK